MKVTRAIKKRVTFATCSRVHHRKPRTANFLGCTNKRWRRRANARGASFIRVYAMFESSAPTKTCPACGQVIIPDRLRLPPIKRRIFEAVQRRPDISAEELRCIVWADDPNGGPEDLKCLHVHVAQLNALLRPLGLMVRSQGGGYRVRRMP
jgi:hypothetical protein